MNQFSWRFYVTYGKGLRLEMPLLPKGGDYTDPRQLVSWLVGYVEGLESPAYIHEYINWKFNFFLQPWSEAIGPVYPGAEPLTTVLLEGKPQKLLNKPVTFVRAIGTPSELIAGYEAGHIPVEPKELRFLEERFTAGDTGVYYLRVFNAPTPGRARILHDAALLQQTDHVMLVPNEWKPDGWTEHLKK